MPEPRAPRLLPPIPPLWGFAEATLFFVVPDVYLSRVALRSLRAAALGCLLATAGALAGGALMYGWGERNPAAAEAALDLVPAISPAALARVADELRGGSGAASAAIIAGGFLGRPYKIYAVEAGRLGMGLPRFLAASALARLPRFLAVALLAAGIARVPTLARRPGAAVRLHLAVWTLFYIFYWSL